MIKQPVCLECKKPMRYNVPRLGKNGGFVHSDNGAFECSKETSAGLALCPCGEVPKELLLSKGSTFIWEYVVGDCCSDWEIEFRTGGHDIDTEE